MNLNDIPCGGYSQRKNEVMFSLYDTDYDTVSALNGKTLTLAINDETIVFDGYHIVSVDVKTDSIQVRFAKDLDDATEASINALETNFTSLRNTVVANQASTSAGMTDISNVIAPIIMREDLADDEAFNFKQFYPEWTVGFDYKKNWIIRYGEDLYRIGQDHTSQEQWVPGLMEQQRSIPRLIFPKTDMRLGRPMTECLEPTLRIKLCGIPQTSSSTSRLLTTTSGVRRRSSLTTGSSMKPKR